MQSTKSGNFAEQEVHEVDSIQHITCQTTTKTLVQKSTVPTDLQARYDRVVSWDIRSKREIDAESLLSSREFEYLNTSAPWVAKLLAAYREA